jgi:hypothetical protein
MATITRPKGPVHTRSSPLLSNHVPSPFPREQLLQLQVDSFVSEDPFVSSEEQVAEPPQAAESNNDLPGVLVSCEDFTPNFHSFCEGRHNAFHCIGSKILLDDSEQLAICPNAVESHCSRPSALHAI